MLRALMLFIDTFELFDDAHFDMPRDFSRCTLMPDAHARADLSMPAMMFYFAFAYVAHIFADIIFFFRCAFSYFDFDAILSLCLSLIFVRPFSSSLFLSFLFIFFSFIFTDDFCRFLSFPLFSSSIIFLRLFYFRLSFFDFAFFFFFIRALYAAFSDADFFRCCFSPDAIDADI